MTYDDSLGQVKQALGLLIEAAAILRPLEGEVAEPTMMVSRGISDIQRMINNHCVQEHIMDYRRSQDES